MKDLARAESLTVRHVGRRAPALRDLDLAWAEGERLLLLGPSGSGKSTLALCLDGVIPHSLDAHWEAGRVLVAGRDTRTAPFGDLARTIGVLFQDPESQLVMLEVDDEIAFGLENAGVPRAAMRARVAEARGRTGLDARTPHLLSELSGGTKQRVALASLLALGPRGIVLDEPSASLDPAGAREILGAFASLAADRERSLLVIEHRVDEVLPFIDRVAILDDQGRLALTGGVDEVFLAEPGRLAALGAWEPQLAALARALEAPSVPRTIEDAAALLARRWPTAGRAAEEGARPRGPVMLAATDLRFAYQRGARPAVDGVSVDVAAGELLAIVGPNGAGKTTLGLLLAGVLRPGEGQVVLAGGALADARAALRRRLAYVFQFPDRQFVAATVREDVLVGLVAHGAADVARRADELLERFGLARLAGANPHSLSGGEQRRLSLATALAGDPDVLILDEPTYGLDRRSTDEVGSLLVERAAEGRAVVVISHDLPFVTERADRVVALADGGVRFEGTPRELFARPDVLERCRLAPPPLAAAFALARALGAAVPAVLGPADLRRSLKLSVVPA